MRLAAAALVFLALHPGCGRETTYEGTGDVVSLQETRAITLRHDDIPGLMPAMVMEFPVRAPALLRGIAPGQRVRFALVREGERLTVTRLEAIGAAVGGGRPLHDHTPHHGGIVAMAGTIHVEIAASPEGRVRVYVSDLWRRPLPVDDVTSEVTVDLPDGPRTLPLVARGGVLEASAPPLLGDEIRAHVRIVRGGDPQTLHFLVPLRPGATGAANVPAAGCTPPEARPGAGPLTPRCAIAFAHPVSAIATTPDGGAVLAGIVDLGVMVLRAPAGEVVTGLAAPPPTEATSDEPPHGVTVNAIAVSPDGTAALVGLERRLLHYALPSGRLVAELPGPGGLVRAVAWLPSGTSALVTTHSDSSARLVRVGDGAELRRLAVEGELSALAVSADGALLAVASDRGSIDVFSADDAIPRRLTVSPRPVEALAFVGPRLVSASADGRLRVWDAATGRRLAEADAGTRLLRLAVAPDGRVAATAGLDRTIRLHDLATGAVIETLAWHRAGVAGLEWAGPVLVSGDTEGWIAFWDVGPDVLDRRR